MSGNQKLKSTCGIHGDLDIHGDRWNDRVILKVLMYDRTNSLLHVENETGMNWISDLSKMEFCLENGEKIPK